MTERIDRTERLLNLVMCLMASSQPVSRAQIRDQIPGYAQAASDSAFERMFERDKDELRSMGVPVETVADASGEVQGYRIPQDRYAMETVELTLEERSAVAVAAQVWAHAVAAPLAGVAMRKLESTVGAADEWVPADLRGSIQLTTSDGALMPLMSALRLDRVVTFPYRTPTDAQPRVRTVSPWGLRSGRGHWFLIGHDHDRSAMRTFRLSRVTGPVTVTAQPRTVLPPEDFDVASAQDSTDPDGAVRARVRVTPGRAASLRRRAVDEPDPWSAVVISVQADTMDELVGLLCGAGPDATVLEPAPVVEAVTAALAGLAADQPGGAS
jgi:proteasome accessory factor B